MKMKKIYTETSVGEIIDKIKILKIKKKKYLKNQICLKLIKNIWFL